MPWTHGIVLERSVVPSHKETRSPLTQVPLAVTVGALTVGTLIVGAPGTAITLTVSGKLASLVSVETGSVCVAVIWCVPGESVTVSDQLPFVAVILNLPISVVPS